MQNVGSNFVIRVLFFILLTCEYIISQEERIGSLYNFVKEAVECMPKKDSYGFVIPDDHEIKLFGYLVDSVLKESFFTDSISRLLGYKFIKWYDPGEESHIYYLLVEEGAVNPFGAKKGWGIYIFKLNARRDLAIEVPHPLWDMRTWEIGFDIFQQLECKYFLLAGAHRYANGKDPSPADVTHSTQNIFHVVHQKVSPDAEHSLQIHGFNKKNSPDYNTYPEIVLSNGIPNPSEILLRLERFFTEFGLSVGIYDGVNYRNLGATQNEQGRWSNANGYSFIHMELEHEVRFSAEKLDSLLRALGKGFPVMSGKQKSVESIVLKAYPNPFRKMTTIFCQVPEVSKVRIDIFALDGRLMNSFWVKRESEGRVKAVWDGKNGAGKILSAGVYLIMVSSGSMKGFGKVTFIK